MTKPSSHRPLFAGKPGPDGVPRMSENLVAFTSGSVKSDLKKGVMNLGSELGTPLKRANLLRGGFSAARHGRGRLDVTVTSQRLLADLCAVIMVAEAPLAQKTPFEPASIPRRRKLLARRPLQRGELLARRRALFREELLASRRGNGTEKH